MRLFHSRRWRHEGKRWTDSFRGPRYGAVKTESMLIFLSSLPPDDASSTTGVFTDFTQEQREELIYIAVSERDREGD